VIVLCTLKLPNRLVRDFKRRGLAPLFQLATDTAYQSHVRVILLEFIIWLWMAGSSINFPRWGWSWDHYGRHRSCSRALECPHKWPPDLVRWKGTPRCGIFPTSLTVQEMVDDMCGGQYTNEHCNCTSKSLLTPYLWFVDTVLQKNVCPLGHKT
jgi:hypothetical protein